MEITLDVVEQLAKLLTKHKLDKIKLGELEIVKSRHEVMKVEKPMMHNTVFDEELLYMSGAPALTAEEIEAYAIDPMPLPTQSASSKRSKKKE